MLTVDLRLSFFAVPPIVLRNERAASVLESFPTPCAQARGLDAGCQGPTCFALTAWFRVHLMDGVANRSFFFGPDCALCTDSRVTVQRNGLMLQ